MPFPFGVGTITSSEQARRLGSKGGKVRSPAKKLAAKIRSLKRFGDLTNEKKKAMVDFLTNPDLGAAEIYNHALKLASLKDPQAITAYSKLLLEIHKQVHGTKVRSENVNLNIESSMEEFKKQMEGIFDGC